MLKHNSLNHFLQLKTSNDTERFNSAFLTKYKVFINIDYFCITQIRKDNYKFTLML